MERGTKGERCSFGACLEPRRAEFTSAQDPGERKVRPYALILSRATKSFGYRQPPPYIPVASARNLSLRDADSHEGRPYEPSGHTRLKRVRLENVEIQEDGT
jgi:hypothetical protein